MDLVEKVTVGGKEYHIAQAPALKQKTLMTLIGAKITMNLASSGLNKIDTSMLIGALMSMDEPILDEITGIVLHQCIYDKKKITVNDFQGQIHSFFTLLAEAVNVNLSDFFIWLENASKEEPTTSPDPTTE